MKSRSPRRSVIENLEARQLLSAAVTSQITAQTYTVGGAAQTVTLASKFDDTVVPTGDSVVEFTTNLPAPNNQFPVVLSDATAPNTVANFKRYLTAGKYANAFIHRSVPGFIIQGGGYTYSNNSTNTIVTYGAINGEASTAEFKNTTGTIAMALSTGPNSGTDEWFFNLANNTTGHNPNLDDTSDGGPFTAFGKVIYNGLTTINTIAGFQVVNAGSPFDALPVQNYSSGSNISGSNLIFSYPSAVVSPLNYAAVSSNPAAASVTVTNGVLTVTPHAAGTAAVTVTATDLAGGTASINFPVTVGTVAGTPAVTVADSTATAGAATSLAFPVTLSAPATLPVTFAYTALAGTAPASDFTAATGTVTIPAGSTTATITVPFVGNSTGAAETVALTLSSPTNATLAATTATGTILPGALTTTTTLSANSPTVVLGNSIVLTATVTPLTGAAVNTGTVTFTQDGTTLGTANVSNGSATFTTIPAAAGQPTFTASYSGNSTIQASASSAVVVSVTTVTPTTTKSTLPGSVVAGTKANGNVVVSITNNRAAAEKGVVTIRVYASTTGTAAGAVLLRSVRKSVNLKSSGSTTVVVPVSILPATLTAGSYTLISQTVDTSGNVSTAASGLPLLVGPATVTLSAAITKLTTVASVVAGTKTNAQAVVQITNTGNTASTGLTTIQLYASTDGLVAGATLIRSIPKRLTIKPGKAVNVGVPLGSYPIVADGSYKIVAVATDAAGHTATAVAGVPVTIAAAFVNLTSTAFTALSTATAGKPTTVAVTFKNNGNITASGAMTVQLSISSTPDGSNAGVLATPVVRIKLAAGKSQTVRLKLLVPPGTPRGTYYFVSTIDSADIFNESPADNTTVAATATSVS